jgi:hypothetical protein
MMQKVQLDDLIYLTFWRIRCIIMIVKQTTEIKCCRRLDGNMLSTLPEKIFSDFSNLQML